MSVPNTEDVNTSITDDETHSLSSHEIEGVGDAAGSLRVLITSKEVMRQVKAATDPLTRQLEKLFGLIKELRRDSLRCNEETSSLTQGPLRPQGHWFDNC